MQKGLRMAKKNLELQLVTEKVRNDSQRVKKLLQLLHDYRFDDYNTSAFEKYVTLDLSKEEFKEINRTGLSAHETLRRVLEEAPDTAMLYAWWKHYYTYLPEFTEAYNNFMKTIDTIPPINSFEITDSKGREKFVDNEFANTVEAELIRKLTPRSLEEFLIKLTAEYSRRWHSTQVLSMTLSGYTLFDEFNRFGVPQIEELKGWMSPSEIETQKKEQEAVAVKAKAEFEAKQKAEMLKTKLASRYNKTLLKYIETLVDAYSKLQQNANENESEVKVKKRVEHFNAVLEEIKAKALTVFQSNTWFDEMGLISDKETDFFAKSLQNKALSNVDNVTRVVLNQTSLMFWNGLSAGLPVSELKIEMTNALVK